MTDGDLLAALVEHAVLVVELDQLGLLVDDQDRLGEDRASADERSLADVGAAISRLAVQLLLDLGRVALVADRQCRVDLVEPSWLQRIGCLNAVVADVVGPDLAVPIAQLMAAHRVRMPAGRGFAHARQHTWPSILTNRLAYRSWCTIRITSRANGSSWRPAMRSVIAIACDGSSTRPLQRM